MFPNQNNKEKNKNPNVIITIKTNLHQKQDKQDNRDIKISPNVIRIKSAYNQDFKKQIQPSIANRIIQQPQQPQQPQQQNKNDNKKIQSVNINKNSHQHRLLQKKDSANQIQKDFLELNKKYLQNQNIDLFKSSLLSLITSYSSIKNFLKSFIIEYRRYLYCINDELNKSLNLKISSINNIFNNISDLFEMFEKEQDEIKEVASHIAIFNEYCILLEKKLNDVKNLTAIEKSDVLHLSRKTLNDFFDLIKYKKPLSVAIQVKNNNFPTLHSIRNDVNSIISIDFNLQKKIFSEIAGVCMLFVAFSIYEDNFISNEKNQNPAFDIYKELSQIVLMLSETSNSDIKKILQSTKKITQEEYDSVINFMNSAVLFLISLNVIILSYKDLDEKDKFALVNIALIHKKLDLLDLSDFKVTNLMLKNSEVFNSLSKSQNISKEEQQIQQEYSRFL